MITKEYLQSHTIKKEFAESMGWILDDDKQEIVIQIFDENGKFLSNRYRHLSGPSKFSADKGSHTALYAAHLIKNQNTVVLAEGEPDTTRLWQEKIPAVTGTSGVKTFSPKIAEPLKGKKVLITLDTDEEGQTSIEKYYHSLEAAGADPYIKDLPKEYKDVCEYFTAGHSREEFLAIPEITLDDWLNKNEPEEFDWKTTDEILEEKLPEEKWLIDKIIPVEGFCFWVGPEATAKSFHALLIAKSLITGQLYLDRFEVKKKTNVLIIDKENTKRRIQDRLRGLGIKKGEHKIYYLKCPQALEVNDSVNEDGFTDFVKSVARKVKKNKIGFIVVDSFTDLLVGEENDRGDIQKFVSAFKQLFPDIAYMILHHASKYQPGGNKPKAQMTRGSTNINAQAYTAFHSEAVRKSKTEFIIEQTKAGDALKMNPFIVELESENDPIHEGETLVTNILYKGEVQDKEEKLDEAMEIITKEFAEVDRIPKKELEKNLVASGTIKSATFRRALDQMEKDGQIEKMKSKTVTNGKDIVWKENNIVTE